MFTLVYTEADIFIFQINDVLLILVMSLSFSKLQLKNSFIPKRINAKQSSEMSTAFLTQSPDPF